MAFIPTFPFVIFWILSIIFTIIGILFFIHSSVTQGEPWELFSILIFITAIIISYLMLTNALDPKNMQTLLNTYITVETAILSVIFAIIAIKPRIPRNLKNAVDNSIILSVGCLLFTLIIYCTSFVAKQYVNNPLTTVTIIFWPINEFNILWSASTFLIFIQIVNFMLLTVQIFKIRVSVNRNIYKFP
jgi:hypothetical protein